MDIKKALSSILPSQIKTKDPVERTIKSENATEREGNGQMSWDQQQKPRPPMSDEELKQAKEKLLQIEAVQNSGWIVEEAHTETKKVLLVKDAEGKIVRRIMEEEIWQLLEPPDKNRGRILNRAA